MVLPKIGEKIHARKRLETYKNDSRSFEITTNQRTNKKGGQIMARRIQIVLPDGIHKRTAVASVDKSEKMGPNFYLEIFAKGLLVCENEIKEQRQQKPKGKQ